MDCAVIKNVRKQLVLDESIVFLNSASFGPLSKETFRFLEELRYELASSPENFLTRTQPSLLWNARQSLAGFLGCDPLKLLFTVNSTVAINWLSSVVPLQSGDEIVITDHEYPTMKWCWERVALAHGCKIRVIKLPKFLQTADQIIDLALKIFTEKTKLFFFSHVIYSTGLVLPINELCEISRSRGIITVVDGAHGPVFTEIHLDYTQCDFYVGSGHKWLLAPTGTAFIYFGNDSWSELKPLHTSWGYRINDRSKLSSEKDTYGSTAQLRLFECEGTRDLTPWLAVTKALNFIEKFDIKSVRSIMSELSKYTRESIEDQFPLKSISPSSSELGGGMVAFSGDFKDVFALKKHLWDKYKIEVGAMRNNDEDFLRISTHFFNDKDEIDFLCKCLQELGVTSWTT